SLLGAAPDLLHGLSLFLQFCFAGFGQRVGALPCRAVGGHHSLIFQLLQGWIDCACTRFVNATGFCFQLFHEFIAVLWPGFKHREQGQANLSGAEEPAPTAAASPGERSTHKGRGNNSAPPTSTSSVHSLYLCFTISNFEFQNLPRLPVWARFV